jgi:hypothetical protein
VPPFVTASGPWHLFPGAFQYQDMLNQGTIFERGVYDGFGRDGFSTTSAFVSSNNNAAFAI